MIFGRNKSELPDPSTALPGRETRPFVVPREHEVLHTPLEGEVPEGFEVAIFGLGWPNWMRLGVSLFIGLVIYFGYGNKRSKLAKSLSAS